MFLDELAYVKHMLDDACYLEGAVATLERAAFLSDPTLQRAFVRSLDVIGEAAEFDFGLFPRERVIGYGQRVPAYVEREFRR